MKENWTNTQRQVLYTLLEKDTYNDNFKQKDLAKDMGISESAMSRRISSSGIRLYLSSRNSIAKAIVNKGELEWETWLLFYILFIFL